MVNLESKIEVRDRSPEQVFDFMIDFRNENDWDQFNRNATKVTAGPIGVATRFTAQNVKLGPVEVEVIDCLRPAHFAYRIVGKMGTMIFSARFEARGAATQVTMKNELAPRGVYRLMAPLIGAMMRKQQPRHQEKLKRYMESQPLVGRAD